MLLVRSTAPVHTPVARVSCRLSCNFSTRLCSLRTRESREKVHWLPVSNVSIKAHRSYSVPSSSSSLIKASTRSAPHYGYIQILELNSPKNKNAISLALLRELRRWINSVRDDAERDVRAVIIASALPDVFCAGADLKERKGWSNDQVRDFLSTLRQLLHDISSLPVPTISAISSVALGGGLELALSTHLRVIHEHAQVGLPETRLAIIPGAGGTWRLPALIGRSRALEMMLTGRRVKGTEAHSLGIAERLVKGHYVAMMSSMTSNIASISNELPMALTRQALREMNEIMVEYDTLINSLFDDVRERYRINSLKGAVQLAEEICQGGPGATKRILEAVSGQDGTGEERENRAYEGLLLMEDRMEALEAFGEKRKPVFKGR